jgi:hypothetical protein
VVVIDDVTIQDAAGQQPPLQHASVAPATTLAPILAKLITGKLRAPVALEAMVLGLALASVPVRLGPLMAGLLAIAGTLLAARLLKLR